jgi:pimeloyl-ACP methyl ester carboxylesterase
MPTVSADPALEIRKPAGVTQAVALVLHGGQVRSHGQVRARQLAVLRMQPIAATLERTGGRHGLAVARLRYLVRGWNGEARSPVPDVRWALDRITERFPYSPVALVGHSMGGRASIYAADHPAVHSVVGLAPWVEPGDPVELVTGRDVLVVHGDHDHMTSPTKSRAWVEQARSVAASASYVSIHGERHAMLRRPALWHALAARYVLGTVCGVAPSESANSAAADVVRKVLAGQPSLVV